MSGYVVVDASLAIKWLLREENSPHAHARLAIWDREERQLAAPQLFRFEVTNALHRRVVRGELAAREAAALAEDLFSDFEFGEPLLLHTRALELASELGQGAAYDSHYLALAEALECEYWTADERFWRAASAAFDFARSLSEVEAPG
ncbi:MAG: type II toxin-antitoxin system VapC family toxin [Chloroflexi bacterium]|nr:type II toxin-antitoxin system VapC family toxin [Chloroflexota bacterium]MCY3602632.1 type II toxin-antitoxin system VapC family toxin [Chloroflexota bacterium]